MKVNYLSRGMQELIGSSIQLEEILNSPELMMWYKDLNSNTFWISRGLTSIFSYERDEFEGEEIPWLEAIFPEDRALVENAYQQQVFGISTDITYRIIQHTGQIRWLRERSTPTLDSEGNVTAVSGSVTDITDYKLDRNSQVTHKKEVGLSSDTQALSDELGYLTLDELNETLRLQQGMIFKFKKVNDHFVHTLCEGELLYRLGLHPSSIIGKKLQDFLPRDIVEMKNQCCQKAWNGEKVTYEGELNGIHYLANLSPIIRNGNVVEVIGSCIDLTERINAERALQASEHLYRLITENMTDLIILFNLNGEGLYASPSHEKVLGYKPDFFEGKSTVNIIHPEDFPIIERQFEEVIQTKSPIKTEIRLLHANGEWRLVEATGSPVLSQNGEVEHLIVVSRDITEKRRAEELLWKSEKLSLVGKLAAGVAHEIRNPLTSIRGFMQLFQQGIIKPDYFNVILTELNRVEDIIKEFLSLAKPQELKFKPVNISTLIKDIDTLIRPEVHLKDIDFHIDVNQGIPMVLCDANQIKQVLLNLCKNSIEAIDIKRKGIVKITVNVDETNHILIKVIDNGVEIGKERLKRLGEPYYSNKEKGTGLGLMLCFRIIRDHRGTITFESVENQGTTVTIRLPFTPQQV